MNEPIRQNRIAVFSDVHGNLAALDAILHDIDAQNVDEIVFAGDLCLVGPRPAQCLTRIRKRNIVAIYGNTDDWVLQRQQRPLPLADLAQWTLEQLAKGARAWLNGLPFAHRIAPLASGDADLLIVHANPQDVNQIIFPAEEEQEARYGRIRQTDVDLDSLLAGLDASIMAYGHLHIPGQRRWRDKLLINISSASMAGDGDPRAKYGLFDWTGNEWLFERRFVTYDVNQEIAAYRDSRPPGWQRMVEALELNGIFPQNV